jgi:hypothetical protein
MVLAARFVADGSFARQEFGYDGVVRRGAKIVGSLIAAALLLLVAAVAVEHVRGRWALHRSVKGLEARGEKLSVAAVEPKHPGADQNGFADLAKVTNRLSTVMTDMDPPPSLRFAAPGRAVVAWRLKEWTSERRGSKDWTELEPALDRERDLLAVLHTAVEKPAYDSGFDYRKGFVDFRVGQLATVKYAANLLSAATLNALHTNQINSAFDELHALILLTARQTPEPLVISQLVRIACAAIALNTTWQALQAQGWTDSQLASLQAAWEQCDFVKDMAYAFDVERALDIDFFEQVKHSSQKLAFALDQRQKAQEMLEGLVEPAVPPGFLHDWMYVPLWRIAWADQDELRALDRWQRMIERERFARTNFWVAPIKQPSAKQDSPALGVEGNESLNQFDRLRFLFSREPFSITDTMIRRVFSTQTQQQMAVTALALQRYRLRLGKVSPDLNALVPDYVHELPRDWMDGKALRYRVLPGGGFTLYSVGEDGTDDGGEPRPSSNKKQYRRLWDGRDAVWPTAASDEEAGADVDRSVNRAKKQ